MCNFSGKVGPLLFGLLGLAAVSGLLVGCSESEGIVRYEVARPVPQDRMLAAILPRGDQAWFFKVTGANAVLSEREDAFRAFVASVQFGEDGTPAWTLPSGWRRADASGTRAPMFERFATIEMDAEGGPLELTVTQLAVPPGDLAGYLLANVNRWRGQMGLKPLLPEQFSTETTQIDVAGTPATLVSLAGNLGAPSMSGAPFAGGSGFAPAAPVAPPAGDAGETPLTCEAPEGWSPGEREISRGGIRLVRAAAFDVKDGDQQVEVTVTQMPGSPDSLAANVNRWRQQVQLDELAESDLAAELVKVDVGGAPGDLVELVGPSEAILGVIAFRDGMAWYIKLQGDRELALRERERFDEFVKSIRFKD